MSQWLSPTVLNLIALKAARVFEIALVFELLVFLLSKRVDFYLKPVIAQDAGRDPSWRLRRRNKLRGVGRGVLRALLYTVAMLLILAVFDINMFPVYFGVAVVAGVALFVLRPLLQDLCAGYVILAEDQFAPGDQIKVGEIAGTVESMSLRQTTVRDSQDQEAVHLLSNREIRQLTTKRVRTEIPRPAATSPKADT